MADYIVVRNSLRGKPTADVILFFAPVGKKPETHIRRIEKISGFKFVGMLNHDREDLDNLTKNGAISDAAVLKRTGIDLTTMTF